MRVIGGSVRGRTLKGPPPERAGERAAPAASMRGTRPTSDLIRGVIFDMLDALGADYTRVLDLYAGTGALGIEALSRGDGTCDFVEQDPRAVEVIRANLAATRFSERANIHRMRVENAASRLRDVYSLVLADPPYYDSGAIEAITAIGASPLVGAETVFVLEHHKRVEAPDVMGPLPVYRARKHGDTVVTIYAQEDDT